MAVRGYRLPEQADARPAAPGMSRQHIEQLRPVDQLLATAPLDVPEEAAGPDEAGEVEQGAAGLCGGDAVDIDDLAAIQVRALVHDEADRQSVVWGKSVYVSVNTGGRRINKK